MTLNVDEAYKEEWGRIAWGVIARAAARLDKQDCYITEPIPDPEVKERVRAHFESKGYVVEARADLGDRYFVYRR